MSENNVTDAAVTKSSAPAAKRKGAGRTVKLKSSRWYQGAVRSIGITRERVLKQISRRPRQKRKVEAKVARVAAVIIDQIVACPSCGNPTRLSEMRKFECKQCGLEVTAEEALRALEISENGISNVRRDP
jgi:predicted RNA-binding Zn-ribbon protein involved in translation (DUF1610 family)